MTGTGRWKQRCAGKSPLWDSTSEVISLGYIENKCSAPADLRDEWGINKYLKEKELTYICIADWGWEFLLTRK